MAKTCAFVILQHNPDNKYIGNRWVVMASPLGRIHHLEEAIQMAEGHLKTNEIETDLKIAICPEHFLSKKHSYPLTKEGVRIVDMFHEISDVIPILQLLKKMSDRYPDWLIIPGTLTVFGLDTIKGQDVTLKTLTPRLPSNVTDDVSKEARLTNVSFGKFQQKQIESMQSKAESEFRPCYNLSPVYLGGKIVLIRRKVFEAFHNENSLERIGESTERTFFPMLPSQSILECAGLKVGIEICAEHEHGYVAWQARGSLDLHIVISNEVYPFAEHCGINDSGLFVHAGSTLTGIYRQGELPSSTASLEFTYKNQKQPGVHFFLERVGE